jgi:hypothetical protein
MLCGYILIWSSNLTNLTVTTSAILLKKGRHPPFPPENIPIYKSERYNAPIIEQRKTLIYIREEPLQTNGVIKNETLAS